jgi:hypothetical protein
LGSVFSRVNSNCKCATSHRPKDFMGCPVSEAFSWSVI